jgi:hypothetical protein
MTIDFDSFMEFLVQGISWTFKLPGPDSFLGIGWIILGILGVAAAIALIINRKIKL